MKKKTTMKRSKASPKLLGKGAAAKAGRAVKNANTRKKNKLDSIMGAARSARGRK